MATSGADGTVQLWDPAHPQATARVLFTGPADSAPVAFSPSGQLLATSSASGAAVLWNVATGSKLAMLPASSSGLESLAFSPDGRTLAASTFGGTAEIWDVATGQRLAVIQTGPRPSGSALLGMAYSPDGRTLALVSSAGDVLLWDVHSRRVTGLIKTGQPGVTAVAYSPDGQLMPRAERAPR